MDEVILHRVIPDLEWYGIQLGFLLAAIVTATSGLWVGKKVLGLIK